MVQLIRPEPGFATIVVQGEPTGDELFTVYSELLQRDPGARTLWDLSSANLRTLTTEAIRRLAGRVAELGKTVRAKGVKSAILCAHTADYGIARMLVMYVSTEGYSARIRVFLDLDDARAWLAA